MYITLGPSTNSISEAEYAAKFKPDQYDIYDSTPEQIFSKYNVKDMSEKDYDQMETELWENKNPESHYMGLMLMTDDIANHYADEVNGTPVTQKSHYNFMNAVEEDYKKELSAGGNDANYYLKLYQYLSQANGQQVC